MALNQTAREGDGPDPHPVRRRAEAVLWSTRLLTLVGVIGLLVTAAVVAVETSRDVAELVRESFGDRSSSVIADVVKILDGYLVVAILVLVAFGLYDLFVDRLDHAHHPSARAPGSSSGAVSTT